MTVVTATIAPVGDGVVHVAFNGTLSMATTVEVRRVLHKCLAEQPIAVIVDVAGLRVDDPLQLAVFPAAAAGDPGATIVLVGPSPSLRAVLMASWILRSVAVCDTAEQAVALLVDHAVEKLNRVNLPPDVTAPGRARAVAAKFCEENSLWDVMDSVMLVTSELVSNAVRHGHSAPGFRLALRGHYLYVSVRDHSTRPPVICDLDLLNASPPPPSGRGLYLVDVHTSAWGSLPMNHQKTVWAAIRVAPAVAEPSF